jgi:hypothetical protein
MRGLEYFHDEEFRLRVSGFLNKIMIRYDAMMDIIGVQSENKELFTLIKKKPLPQYNNSSL